MLTCTIKSISHCD